MLFRAVGIFKPSSKTLQAIFNANRVEYILNRDAIGVITFIVMILTSKFYSTGQYFPPFWP